MGLLGEHLYAYKKGIRRLILFTTRAEERARVEGRLMKEGIAFHTMRVGRRKINVFFGDGPCVRVIRAIGKPRLKDLTAEEDFLLGTMLGYDLAKQCDRYLERKEVQFEQLRAVGE